MSKFTKLLNNPKAYFVDGFRNRVSGPISKKNHPTKPAAKAAPSQKISASMRSSIKSTGQVELLKTMITEGDYDVVKRVWSLMETSGKLGGANLTTFLSLRAETELVQANHEAVMHFGKRMIDEYENPVGYYFRAKSQFICGNYDEAMAELANLLRERPKHADGVYLLCEICERTGSNELAWRSLESLAETSKRVKTWHVMANLISQSPDLVRLLLSWNKWKTNGIGPVFHQDVSEFIALGALRAGNFEMARNIWRETLFSAAKKKGGFGSLKNRKPSYSSARAETALSELNAMFNKAKIEMFLVSGTLLGCVREGRLLGHDKDIDVGIWSTVPSEKVFKLATTSGKFLVLKSRSPEILRLKHVNGIAIDVFYHFKEKNDYWHGGVKMIWHNSPFKLIKRNFLGEDYLIPENYDLYLSENYGDWQTPMITFDSAFDTPNGEVKSKEEMAIHTFKGLMASCIDENWERVAFYLTKLQEQEEEEFVREFEDAHLTSEDVQAALESARQAASPDTKDTSKSQGELVH